MLGLHSICICSFILFPLCIPTVLEYLSSPQRFLGVFQGGWRASEIMNILEDFDYLFSLFLSLFQGPRSNFGTGGGTISYSILGGWHKTLSHTNSL